MQWSPDRNGGFSRADPARLFLPAIQDPIYGFDAVNVESQMRAPASLLNWLRRMLAVRRSQPAFGRGTLRFLYPSNRKVLAYLREDGDERILCVANVSRAPQAVELDLAEFKGSDPTEMTAGSPFPRIGELPYMLTMPGYGFYWFRIGPAVESDRFGPRPTPELFTLVLTGGIGTLLEGRERAAFERTIAPGFLPHQRWFAGKGSRISHVSVRDAAALPDQSGRETFMLPLLDVTLRDGSQHRYFTPLSVEEGRDDDALVPYAVAKVRRGARTGYLTDATTDPEFALCVVEAMRAGRELKGERGTLRFTGTAQLADMPDVALDAVARLGAEQSNSTIALADHMALKIYRRLQPGVHPELEVGRFLTEVAGYANTPALLGAVEHIGPDGGASALAILQRFVRNQGDAWTLSVDVLKRELDSLALTPDSDMPPLAEIFAIYRKYAKTLGKRTAELHRAFATPTDDPAFAAEPLNADDMRAAADDARAMAERAFAAIGRIAPQASDAARDAIEALQARRDACFDLIEALAVPPEGALKTRIHGDYHLGQVLIVQDDVMIVDFEGEPARSVDERRQKASPLRDVAGMLRSFAYAADTVTRDYAQRMAEIAPRVEAITEEWRRIATTAFLAAYEGTARGSPVWVEDQQARRRLMRFHLLAKALYEINYEADNRPEWIETPVKGVVSLIDEESTA
jgi:maltose alpha-D-glucosyltransferase/alpha-amylase